MPSPTPKPGQEHERFLLNQKSDSFQAKFEQLAKKCNAEEIAIEERHRLFSELCKQFPVAG